MLCFQYICYTLIPMKNNTTLHLVLKHHWFDKIVSGEKKHRNIAGVTVFGTARKTWMFGFKPRSYNPTTNKIFSNINPYTHFYGFFV